MIVARCDVYLGLFGDNYGAEDSHGLSPTHQEFDFATRQNKHRLIFVKGIEDSSKHPKMRALIQQAGDELIRRRFASTPEPIAGVYAALVQFLESRELLLGSGQPSTPVRPKTWSNLSADLQALVLMVWDTHCGIFADHSARLRDHPHACDPGCTRTTLLPRAATSMGVRPDRRVAPESRCIAGYMSDVCAW